MALPTNATPVYTLTIPSTKKEFKYRPFLVKDEKALLIAQQSEDTLVMLDTVKEVIASCAKSKIDVNKLASFDIEYIFMKLRTVSVDDRVTLIFACDTCTTEDAQAPVLIDLTKVEVQFPEDHTNKIPLFNEVGIVMKYPTMNTLKKLDESAGANVDSNFQTAIECIDYIYDGDELFYAKDIKPEELTAFLENLTSQQFKKVKAFFETMPALKVDVTYTCPVCNTVHNKYMKGLASFF